VLKNKYYNFVIGLLTILFDFFVIDNLQFFTLQLLYVNDYSS